MMEEWENEMSTGGNVLEGTWEQINLQAGRLAGRCLRVEVVANGRDSEGQPLPFHATASPEAQAQPILDWGYRHAPRNAPPLSEDAICRESIYSEERD